jgi:hypothetical protein
VALVSIGATHSTGAMRLKGGIAVDSRPPRRPSGEYVSRVRELACRSHREKYQWRHPLQPDEQPHV